MVNKIRISVKSVLLILVVISLLSVFAFFLAGCNNNNKPEDDIEKDESLKLNFIVEGEVYDSIDYTANQDSIKLPEDPVKDGYIFDGWYWDYDIWEEPYTLASLSDRPLTEKMMVYAKFSEIHRHSFSEDWSTSSMRHWHAATCGCDMVVDEESHTFNDQYICTVCDYSDMEYKLNEDGASYTLVDSNVFKDIVVVPSTYKGLPVTVIGKRAFWNNWTIERVTIPDSVISIESEAFHYCKELQKVNLSDGVKYIGDFAFKGCGKLTNVTFGNGLERIGFSAFYACVNLTDITIPDGVTDIGYDAFRSCYSLTEIVIPDSVERIYPEAFAYCDNLTKVTIGKGVTYMGESAFDVCINLDTVILREGIKHVNNRSFRYCDKLKSLNYEGTVEQWGDVEIDGLNYAGEYYIETVVCSDGEVPFR